MKDPWIILGTPKAGGILVVCDHASNHVPDEIDLGIDRQLMSQHIAYDIGVTGVASFMVELTFCAAFLATNSRLVVDLNRYPDDASAIPVASDGYDIVGNHLDAAGRQARLARYFTPYHAALADSLNRHRPALILSVHSFTPRLETDPSAERPWEIGVLYNEQELPSSMAIERLEGEGLIVGDQLPYSGRQLNATMNRHAEANEIPYVGIEIRQDLIGDAAGQERFAAILGEMAQYVVERLASEALS
ncbi:MAG: N-formylglutamate amidohydrolase [Sphingomonadales bacterium]|uniref:N-formylglutamate amidohydrolase n=2 Tax=Sphingorhabdus sp. TaxID=1902408 RepID=UPI003BAE822F|nr:N-formylglutamate amidohydrolase [Sphingomonadales bacterium]MBK9431804.1 N-formylglutamate amidohydrolase [Sphingomonadales bacterium]MBL0022914.1 N-formylglutamate amidohydrolase [Sphingomonadales bacterium]